MLAVKINNPEIETRFKQYAIEHKKAIEDLVNDALKMFLDMNKKSDKLVYTKKDPMKHLHAIEHDNDDEDLSDVKPYGHIEDSASYIHNLRRVRAK